MVHLTNWCWHCNGPIIDGEPRKALPHRNGDHVEIHKSCELSYNLGIIKSWVGIK